MSSVILHASCVIEFLFVFTRFSFNYYYERESTDCLCIRDKSLAIVIYKPVRALTSPTFVFIIVFFVLEVVTPFFHSPNTTCGAL